MHIHLIVFTHRNQFTFEIHLLEKTLHPLHRLVTEKTTLHISIPRSLVHNPSIFIVYNHRLIHELAERPSSPTLLIDALSPHLAILVIETVAMLVAELLVILCRTHQLSTLHNPLVIVPTLMLRPFQLGITMTISIVPNPNNLLLLTILFEQSRFDVV